MFHLHTNRHTEAHKQTHTEAHKQTQTEAHKQSHTEAHQKTHTETDTHRGTQNTHTGTHAGIQPCTRAHKTHEPQHKSRFTIDNRETPFLLAQLNTTISAPGSGVRAKQSPNMDYIIHSTIELFLPQGVEYEQKRALVCATPFIIAQ